MKKLVSEISQKSVRRIKFAGRRATVIKQNGFIKTYINCEPTEDE